MREAGQRDAFVGESCCTAGDSQDVIMNGTS
jgi:hypothetical protein